MKVSIIVLALLTLFVGAVTAGWVTVTGHTLGVLEVIVAIIVLILEVFYADWLPWRHV